MSARSSILSDEQPRKKMRKGTHSCTECRRRKKSCIVRQGSSSCEECLVRGVQCRNQEVGVSVKHQQHAPVESKQNLQRRVTQLESALQSIVQKLDNDSSHETGNHLQNLDSQNHRLLEGLIPTPASSSPSYTPSPESTLNAPVLSLFNNSILSRRDGESDQGLGSVERGTLTPTKIHHIRRTLLSLFPSDEILQNILEVSKAWWPYMQAMFPQIFGPEAGANLGQFIAASRSSGSVQRIAKALLCISNSLQESPMDYKFCHHPGIERRECCSINAQDLGQQYITTVDELVLSKDELAGTMDGIECILLRAKHDTNDGRVRRAWISFRRCMSFANLLGLHLRPNKSLSRSEILRRESLWKAMYQSDRFLSLVLGVPYGMSDAVLHNAGIVDSTPAKDDYLFHLASIIGHIVDRNLEPSSSPNILSMTYRIEGELMDLAAAMPKEWWCLDFDTEGMLHQMFNRLLPTFWHHHARTLLHLPFMLKAITDKRYEFNKTAALESARECIQRYNLIRPVQGFGSLVCKVTDFQVFTAAMVLILNLLTQQQPQQSSPLSDFTCPNNAVNDWPLVINANDILQRAASETHGGVATQAARALDIFCKTRGGQLDCVSKVVIPYFGTVVFGPGQNFVNQAQNSPSEEQQTPQSEPFLQSQRQQQQQQQQKPQSSEAVFFDEQQLANNNNNNHNNFQYPSSMLSFDNWLAPMPLEMNFSAYTGIEGNTLADVNMDLDQDWSWFWDNTEVSTQNLNASI